jgi:hypothetical protein
VASGLQGGTVLRVLIMIGFMVTRCPRGGARSVVRTCMTPHDDFNASQEAEHRWLHIEHLLLACPLVTPPGMPDVSCSTLLRRDLLDTTADVPVFRAVVEQAFPPGGLDPACAAVCTVPFLLDPVTALRSVGAVPRPLGERCVGLVAAFVCGVSARVCGAASVGLAEDVLRRLELPEDSALRALWPCARSAASDAVAAGSTLLDGTTLKQFNARGPLDAYVRP